ncbi:hypothetical protein GXY_13148 [Novacetimonas hansenii ATCC 23769]|uniref:Uncharacterized protein n=1 Tax=Novacetimonas hansenii ATCC 23769 TaxID=714995 RepID=D5QHK1_NOVHA|nr:hypothetical protein GXY_13148 [Novacetimonas hansenii ATCC 23769]
MCRENAEGDAAYRAPGISGIEKLVTCPEVKATADIA